MTERVRLKHKQVYFYVEDGQYSCVVAIYKKNGHWRDGRIIYGKRPRAWGHRTYDDADMAEKHLKEIYDYVEFIQNSTYENYKNLVNS